MPCTQTLHLVELLTFVSFEILVNDEEAILSELNWICGDDLHVIFGVRMPKRRLLVLANLAKDQEEGIIGEECRNLSLGLATKARACEGVGLEWRPRVTIHAPGNVGECEGMNLHTPKWAPTLGVKISIESWWTFKSSENNWRGRNPLDWMVPYGLESS